MRDLISRTLRAIAGRLEGEPEPEEESLVDAALADGYVPWGEEPEEPEPPTQDNTLQASGGGRYSLRQLRTDFRDVGLYELLAVEPVEARLLCEVLDDDTLRLADQLLEEAPEGRAVTLGAYYEGHFVVLTR